MVVKDVQLAAKQIVLVALGHVRDVRVVLEHAQDVHHVHHVLVVPGVLDVEVVAHHRVLDVQVVLEDADLDVQEDAQGHVMDVKGVKDHVKEDVATHVIRRVPQHAIQHALEHVGDQCVRDTIYGDGDVPISILHLC